MLKSALTALLCLASADVWAFEPKPYDAFYDVTVDSWKVPNSFTQAGGSVVVHNEKSCTGWNVAVRFEFHAEGSEGKLNLESQSTMTEVFDGASLKFEIRTILNNQLAAEIAGTASHDDSQIVLTKPRAKTISLPRETLFPVAAAVWSGDQFEKGEKQVNFVLFSGTEEQPTRTYGLLTGVIDLPSPKPEGDQALLQGKAWRTTTSYFTYGGNESEPFATVKETTLPNGLMIQTTYDLDLATLTTNLRRVRALPEPKC